MIMPKLPKDKAGLYVYVDKQVADKLRKLVLIKYKTIYGHLSWEVEQALRAWIADHAPLLNPDSPNQESVEHPRRKQVVEDL
jgi:uncharacterized membrane protein